MREAKRIYTINPRGVLQRGADGKLKPASEETEIADIWAEQKRIRLKEAIEEDQRRALKKQKRSATREIEINLHLPKFKLPSVRVITSWLRKQLAKLSKKQRRVAIGGAFFIVLLLVGPYIFNALHRPGPAKPKGSSSVAGTSTAPIGGSQPEFQTILPAGKTIDQLGGWGRVSPPDKAPAFGYSDMLAGVHIVVSEQQLPDNFATDPNGQLAQVAKQFGSSKKVTTSDGTVIYLGVATNGAESAVASKSNLLILIRSTSKVADQEWLTYVSSLR